MGSRTPDCVRVFPSENSACIEVARRITELIKTRNAEGRPTVLGLCAGKSPAGVYRELARHRKEGISFSRVICFSLDEYYPLLGDEPQSFYRKMQEQLFQHLNIPIENIFSPDGSLSREHVAEFCASYEKRIAEAGGIDIQLLGIGKNGHIGFNEPGSPSNSRTRLVRLAKESREGKDVPEEAITMGIQTILEAKEVFLLAFGREKAAVIVQALNGPIRDAVPASHLQKHPKLTVFVDPEAKAF